MKARFLAIFGITLLFASGAYAVGKYQRTEDRKTRVWNSNPRIKATATWSGARDDDGYATGHGTLTWFRADRSFQTGSLLPNSKSIAVNHFSGSMVRGKFEGTVVTETAEGARYHAKFSKGVMNGEWVAGGAASQKSKQEREETPSRESVVEAPAEGPSPAPVTAVKPAASPVPPAKKENVAQHPEEGKPMAAKPVEEKQTEATDSLQSLAAPPSSLRLNSAPEPSAATNAASPAPTP